MTYDRLKRKRFAAKHLRWLVALVFAAALLRYPETALNAAREAMANWAYAVAPALFPFMVLMPLLTCADAARAYECIFGRFLPMLLGVSGSAAPALAISMAAGSPAGAMAAARIEGIPSERIVCCTCGLSPAFLISGIGAAMLGSAADGRILLRAQLAAQLTMLALARFLPAKATEKTAQANSAAPEDASIAASIRGVFGVCGWMMVFSVSGALAAQFLPNPGVCAALMCALDLPTGALALSRLPIARETRIVLLAAAVGFSGLCIIAQNLAACPGLRAGKLILCRVLAAGVSAAAAAVQLRFMPAPGSGTHQIWPAAILFSVIFCVPPLIKLGINLFLNNSRDLKSASSLPSK